MKKEIKPIPACLVGPEGYPEAERQRKRAYYFKLRMEVIAAYGGRCACCGESTPEFLTIDHINNDGAEHRRAIRMPLYRWLKTNGFPKDGFQLLCSNCNLAKGWFGECPHQRARRELEAGKGPGGFLVMTYEYHPAL